MDTGFARLVQGLFDILSDLSREYGPTGNPPTDILLVIMILFVIFTAVGAYAVFKRSNSEVLDQANFDPTRGLHGKVEKLEMTVNALKTEVARSVALNKGDIEFLKNELAMLRKQIGGGDDDDGGPPPGKRVEREFLAADDFAPETGAVENVEEIVTGEGEKIRNVAIGSPNPFSGGLKRTREGIFGKLRALFSRSPRIDAALLDDLEELLISSDLGVKTVSTLLEDLREEIKSAGAVDEAAVTAMLKQKVLAILEADADPLPGIQPQLMESGPFVVMVVGVNGVGKTTTVAKLAHQWRMAGHKVLMVAADTFRAAAVEQLLEWGVRLGVPVVSGAPEAKPATVVFDAMRQAAAEHSDIVLIDTAGRLHTKANLMQELEGVLNSIRRHQSDAPHETVLVLDGVTGQNALNQAREFNQALKLTGLIITKLDGTPKGGAVVAIKNELGIPVKYIGLGETKDDLKPFVARDFVEALFDSSADSQVAQAA